MMSSGVADMIDAAPSDEDVYDGWDSAFDLLDDQVAARTR
jgi:hypothetical protein